VTHGEAVESNLTRTPYVEPFHPKTMELGTTVDPVNVRTNLSPLFTTPAFAGPPELVVVMEKRDGEVAGKDGMALA